MHSERLAGARRKAWQRRVAACLRSFQAIELRRKATVEMRELRPLMRALREEQRRVLELVK
jgi:hypothetical protein